MTFKLGEVAAIPAPAQRTALRGCSRKIHHRTAAIALAHIDHLYSTDKADRGSLHSYQCPVCRGWLVGHRLISVEVSP